MLNTTNIKSKIEDVSILWSMKDHITSSNQDKLSLELVPKSKKNLWKIKIQNGNINKIVCFEDYVDSLYEESEYTALMNVNFRGGIVYNIKRDSHVQLLICNYNDKIVADLFELDLLAGYYSVEIDSKTVPSGVYYYKLIIEGKEYQKMVLV